MKRRAPAARNRTNSIKAPRAFNRLASRLTLIITTIIIIMIKMIIIIIIIIIRRLI